MFKINHTEQVMKGINILFVAIALLGIFQCKKDKKEVVENILPNGDYGFGYTNQFGSPAYFHYKIIDNNFYIRIVDTLCLNRVAGKIYRDQNGEIKLTKLHIQGLTMVYPCVFGNDYYGGDTEVFIFSNIINYNDSDGKMALKGDCSILMPNGLPYSKLYGQFGLIYNRYQYPK